MHFYNEDAETDEERYSDYQQVTFVNNPVNSAETPVEPSKPIDSPQTGDNSMVGLWVALLFVSATGVAGAAIYSRKKKHSAK